MPAVYKFNNDEKAELVSTSDAVRIIGFIENNETLIGVVVGEYMLSFTVPQAAMVEISIGQSVDKGCTVEGINAQELYDTIINIMTGNDKRVKH